MIKPIWLLSLLLLTACASQPTVTEQQNPETTTTRHTPPPAVQNSEDVYYFDPRTGVKLPRKFNDFEGISVERYNPQELGASIDYKSPQATAVFYFYDLGVPNIGTGLTSQVRQRFKDATEEVRKAYPEAKQDCKREITIKLANNTPLSFLLNCFTVQEKQIHNTQLKKLSTYLLFTGYKNLFLKIRVTLINSNDKKRGEKIINDLLKQLERLLQP